jgi:hypothetical protein
MNLSRSIGDRFLFEIEAMDDAGLDARLLIYLEIIRTLSLKSLLFPLKLFYI